jgi:hypothetical protein
VRIAYVLKRDDLELAVETLAAGLDTYRAARGLADETPLTASARRPDFYTPAV